MVFFSILVLVDFSFFFVLRLFAFGVCGVLGNTRVEIGKNGLIEIFGKLIL